MSVFPLSVAIKEDSPQRLLALASVLEKSKLLAADINEIVAALNELDGRGKYIADGTGRKWWTRKGDGNVDSGNFQPADIIAGYRDNETKVSYIIGEVLDVPLDLDDAGSVFILFDSAASSSASIPSPTNRGTFTGLMPFDNFRGGYFNPYTLATSGTITFESGSGEGVFPFNGEYVKVISDGTTPFATESNLNAVFDADEQYGIPEDYILPAGTYAIYLWKTPDGAGISIPGYIPETSGGGGEDDLTPPAVPEIIEIMDGGPIDKTSPAIPEIIQIT